MRIDLFGSVRAQPKCGFHEKRHLDTTLSLTGPVCTHQATKAHVYLLCVVNGAYHRPRLKLWCYFSLQRILTHLTHGYQSTFSSCVTLGTNTDPFANPQNCCNPLPSSSFLSRVKRHPRWLPQPPHPSTVHA